MKKEVLYKKFAKYYDQVYSKKDYKNEVNFIDSILKKYKIKGKLILDICCGTGNHASLLSKKGYTIFGIDKNPQMLNLARKKVPQAKFKKADMKNFKLNKKFDVIICMFTAINYNLTITDLTKTLKNFKEHIKDNGVIIFDFPILKKPYQPHALFLNKDIIAFYERRDNSQLTETIIYWILRKKNKTEVVQDIHQLRLYTLKEFSEIIKKLKLNSEVYQDFSLNKKKNSKRFIVVCKKT